MGVSQKGEPKNGWFLTKKINWVIWWTPNLRNHHIFFIRYEFLSGFAKNMNGPVKEKLYKMICTCPVVPSLFQDGSDMGKDLLESLLTHIDTVSQFVG